MLTRLSTASSFDNNTHGNCFGGSLLSNSNSKQNYQSLHCYHVFKYQRLCDIHNVGSVCDNESSLKEQN